MNVKLLLGIAIISLLLFGCIGQRTKYQEQQVDEQVNYNESLEQGPMDMNITDTEQTETDPFAEIEDELNNISEDEDLEDISNDLDELG